MQLIPMLYSLQKKRLGVPIQKRQCCNSIMALPSFLFLLYLYCACTYSKRTSFFFFFYSLLLYFLSVVIFFFHLVAFSNIQQFNWMSIYFFKCSAQHEFCASAINNNIKKMHFYEWRRYLFSDKIHKSDLGIFQQYYNF